MANTLRDFDFSSLTPSGQGFTDAIFDFQRLSDNERKLKLLEGEAQQKELQRLDALQSQQGIQDILNQQLGGGTPGLTEPQGIVPGELALTPGGSIGVQAPSRLKPLTQSVTDQQRDISLKLLGFGKAGREALSSISGIFDSQNEQTALQAKQDIEDTQIFALKLDRAKTRQARNKLIEDRQSEEILDTGQINQELLKMRNMSDDELQGEIISDLAIGENLKKFVDNRLETPKKFENVLDAQGNIIAQRNVATGEVKKSPLAVGVERGGIIPSSEITDGFVVKENPNGTFTTTRVLSEAQLSNPDTGKFSAMTTFYDNGTTLQAGPQGSIRVTDPSGRDIPAGAERVEVLKKAREEQINFAQLKAQATKAGSDATAQSTKFFTQTQKLKKSVGNIDQAISLIDAGAKTGPILSRLPSIRSLSIQLDNVQKSMGLDVIGTTTFGALSKGELDLALSKALPTGLKPPALREWLVAKKEAQNKLIDYMENASIFLIKPGNTIAGWIEAQQALQGKTPTVPAETPETPKPFSEMTLDELLAVQ